MDNRGEGDGENEGGIILEKDDLQLIYKALRKYTPTKKEEHLHGINTVRHTYWVDKIVSRCSSVIG